MKKGGYQILDLKGIDISGSGGVKIEGIYETIANTNGKPFLLSGLNLGDGIVKDRFVSLDIEDTSYFGIIDAERTIYIDGDDTVTVEETPQPVPPPATPTISDLDEMVFDSMTGKWADKNGIEIPDGTYKLAEDEVIDSDYLGYKDNLVIVSSAVYISPTVCIIGAVYKAASGAVGALYRGQTAGFTFFPFTVTE